MKTEELKNILEEINRELIREKKLAEGERVITFAEDINSEYVNIIVSPGHLKDVMRILKTDPRLNFDFLFNMTGMDWGKDLGIIYHLESKANDVVVVVRTHIEDRENPEVDSMEDLWFTAHLHEREIYDLFGIRFRGHSNLKRIFLTPGFKGHPLRKDYEDDFMIIRK